MKCKKCGKEYKVFAWGEDVDKIKCECGGATLEILVDPNRSDTYGGVAIHIWAPYLEENICHQPVMVNSKQHLKDLCKKHDVVAHRLD